MTIQFNFINIIVVSIIISLFITTVQCSKLKTEYKSSLKLSTFGSCKQNVLTPDNPSTIFDQVLADNQFHIILIPPAQTAIDEYKTIPPILTRANARLGLGIVKNQSMAAKWANNTSNSWQLAKDHPRNNKTNCVRLSRLAGEGPIQIYEDLMRRDVDYYLVQAHHVIVHETGVVGMQCGYYQAIEACETMFKFIGRNWFNSCTKRRNAYKAEWLDMWKGNDYTNDTNTNTTTNSVNTANTPISSTINTITNSTSTSNTNDKNSFNSTFCINDSKMTIQHVKRVVIITALWDNYHHFLIDCISRIIPIIEYLKVNTDIRIHIRSFERDSKKPKYIASGIQLRNRIMSFLGLDPIRFITGPLRADVAYFPRGVKCNYVISYAYQIRALAKYMIQIANEQTATMTVGSAVLSTASSRTNGISSIVRNKNLIIQQRDRASDPSAKSKPSWREWTSNYTTEVVVRGFKREFGSEMRILPISSADSNYTECLSCQIAEYQRAEILVGLHGAGLTNIMFMSPGSLLIEIVGQFDGRMMPLCGYHGTLAAIFGVHHYIYYYDWKGGEELDFDEIVKEARQFYNVVKKK